MPGFVAPPQQAAAHGSSANCRIGRAPADRRVSIPSFRILYISVVRGNPSRLPLRPALRSASWLAPMFRGYAPDRRRQACVKRPPSAPARKSGAGQLMPREAPVTIIVLDLASIWLFQAGVCSARAQPNWCNRRADAQAMKWCANGRTSETTARVRSQTADASSQFRYAQHLQHKVASRQSGSTCGYWRRQTRSSGSS
jgi:hypothetical protein